MLPNEITQLDADTLIICIDSAVYSRRAIFSTCYQYSDRCYLFLAQGSSDNLLNLVISRKDPDSDLNAIKGEFFNCLLDHELRAQIALETREVRTLIVAQAFAEGNLLDPNQEDGDYNDDPRGIRKHS